MESRVAGAAWQALAVVTVAAAAMGERVDCSAMGGTGRCDSRAHIDRRTRTCRQRCCSCGSNASSGRATERHRRKILERERRNVGNPPVCSRQVHLRLPHRPRLHHGHPRSSLLLRPFARSRTAPREAAPTAVPTAAAAAAARVAEAVRVSKVVVGTLPVVVMVSGRRDTVQPYQCWTSLHLTCSCPQEPLPLD